MRRRRTAARVAAEELDFDGLVRGLESAYREFREPVVTAMTRTERNPFKVLVATLLSLRTRDEQTGPAAERLFALAETPETMVLLPAADIEQAIYPVGFYRVKALRVIEVCRVLLEEHGGQVPSGMEELLQLPGVGRKTANLVLTRGFGLPGICVDTHVHRISNRLGLVRTRAPDETETALRKLLPEQFWIPWNDLLVAFGQNLCKPLSPHCSRCPVRSMCAREGVERSR